MCFRFSTVREPTAIQLEKQGFGYVVASLGKLGSEVPYTTYMTEEGFDRVQDIMDNSDKLEKKAPYDKLINNEYNKK